MKHTLIKRMYPAASLVVKQPLLTNQQHKNDSGYRPVSSLYYHQCTNEC